jgi:hypothetical protein
VNSSALRAIVEFAATHGAPASEEDARLLFASGWPSDRVGGQQHATLYRDAGEPMVVGFARAFAPVARDGVVDVEPDVVLPFGDGLDVPTQELFLQSFLRGEADGDDAWGFECGRHEAAV